MEKEQNIQKNKNPVYNISDFNQIDEITAIFRALSVKERIQILHLILNKPMTIRELSQKLNLPISSVTQHTNVLSDAHLIHIEYKPNQKGFVKLCSNAFNTLKIIFINWAQENDFEETLIEMPIGSYTEFNITPPCGMTGKHSPIGDFDVLSSFYHPYRHKAELLWFSNGNITYKFPNQINKNSIIHSITLSLEICSETFYSKNDWPSDITFWINGHELLTWTSPGDFGGRRGRFTPDYWFINSTQYGLLKTIKIDDYGIYLDDILISTNYNINNLDFYNKDNIEFKIGIKPDAVHKGGINIFGKNFGDHKQPILLKILSSPKKSDQ